MAAFPCAPRFECWETTIHSSDSVHGSTHGYYMKLLWTHWLQVIMDYFMYLPNHRNFFCSFWAATFCFATAMLCLLTYVGHTMVPFVWPIFFWHIRGPLSFYLSNRKNISMTTFCTFLFLFFPTISPFPITSFPSISSPPLTFCFLSHRLPLPRICLLSSSHP